MKPRLLKIAVWSSSIGFCAYLFRRLLLKRRASIDVGAVSEGWLAQRRGVADDTINYQ